MSTDKITWEDYDCWLRISQRTNQFYHKKRNIPLLLGVGGNMSNPDQDLKNA